MSGSVLPRITVNLERCLDPVACRQCLRVCHGVVLRLSGRGHPEKFVDRNPEDYPRDYKIQAQYLLSCTGCMECVRVCPVQAIQVSFGE